MSENQAWKILNENGDWLQKVALAAARVAKTVYNENPATANHSLRASLATQVARSPDQWAKTFGYHIIADDSFLALASPAGVALTLAQLETLILGVFNLLAG